MTLFVESFKMIFSLLIRDFPFNDKFDGVFKNTYNEKDVSIEASGSHECYFPSLDEEILTKPESVIDPNDTLEWCSNIVREKADRPWLSVTFNNKKLSLSGYSVKSGCCDYWVTSCCCLLYSWSLLGSNDNKTWTLLHSQKKNKEFDVCKEKSFQVDKNGSFSMFKLVQDEPEPGCLYCMSIGRLEFYGSFGERVFDNENDDIENEEEISIIGRIKKN